MKYPKVNRRMVRRSCTLSRGRDHPARNPTTSFLTATTLIYAIGAGITAAAGTRLALQLLLTKVCRFGSLQSRDKVPTRYFLSLPL
jgi:hypothetical protein